MPRTVAPARALRGAAVALVGLGVAAAGHVAAGGALTVSPLLLLVVVLVTAATALASGTCWSFARLLATLAGLQVVAHLVLWFDAGGRAADPRLSAVASVGSGHAHSSALGGLTPGMLTAHLVAVVVAAVLLAGADAALALLVALAQRLTRAVVVRRPAPRPRLVGAAGAPSRRPRVLEDGALGRRGPPGALAPG